MKPILLANIVTLVGGVAFVLCGALAFLAPDLLFNISNSWFHAINLEPIRAAKQMSFGTFVLGVITFSAYLWILTYFVAYLYKRLAK